jgi:hypothetical protein
LVSTHKGNSIFLISKNILPKIRGYFLISKNILLFQKKNTKTSRKIRGRVLFFTNTAFFSEKKVVGRLPVFAFFHGFWVFFPNIVGNFSLTPSNNIFLPFTPFFSPIPYH